VEELTKNLNQLKDSNLENIQWNMNRLYVGLTKRCADFKPTQTCHWKYLQQFVGGITYKSHTQSDELPLLCTNFINLLIAGSQRLMQLIAYSIFWNQLVFRLCSLTKNSEEKPKIVQGYGCAPPAKTSVHRDVPVMRTIQWTLE
jgi:hypothetical protein